MTNDYKLYKHVWIFNDAPHKEVKISKEYSSTFLKRGGLMVRNTYSFDINNPTPFWYVLKDNFGGFQELSSNTRNQVRRGQTNYTIRKVTKQEMLQFGYSIQQAATASYKVNTNVVSYSDFEHRIQQADENTEFWGAFNHNDEMTAFSINKLGDNYCDYQTLKANPEDMKNYVYYALIYEMNRYYLEQLKLKYVLDGARSITEHSNIQKFLEDKFHFRKAYCKMHIYYKWWFGIIVKILYYFKKHIKNTKIRAVINMHGMQIIE